MFRLKTYPNITTFKVSDPPVFGVFGGGSTIANIFFVLRNMDILSKQEMFKINQTFDWENFQARAGACARYIQHHIFRISKKSSFFHVFSGVYSYAYLRCFKIYEHTLKTRNVQNQSNFRSEKFSNARGRMRALYLTSYFKDFEKIIIFCFFGSL